MHFPAKLLSSFILKSLLPPPSTLFWLTSFFFRVCVCNVSSPTHTSLGCPARELSFSPPLKVCFLMFFEVSKCKPLFHDMHMHWFSHHLNPYPPPIAQHSSAQVPPRLVYVNLFPNTHTLLVSLSLEPPLFLGPLCKALCFSLSWFV